MKIYDCKKENKEHDLATGIIIATDNELKISVRKGYINIKELQLPGKRKMDTKSLLNGFRFAKDAKVL